MIQVTYPAGTLDRSSPLGNRHAPTDSAYHVADFLDVPDIYVGEKGWRPMSYIPVGAIVAAINMQNTLARQRREEEAKKKEQEKSK